MIIWIIILLGYVVTIFGADFIIRWILRGILKDEQDAELKERIQTGMRDIGRHIGWVERFFILTMVLVGYFEGIGFVLAAKSLLRMGDFSSDLKKKKFSEYVILGTLLSFSSAFVLGLAIRYLLHLPIQIK